LKTNINDFVSFSESIVDQPHWERSGNTRVVTTLAGEPVVEASLLPLMRDFVAWTANPALMGSDFVNNNPTFWSDLWTMDRAFMYMATGLPRWLPIPTLTRGHLALRRMLQPLLEFHIALDKHADGKDPGSGWSNLDDVSEVVKARTAIYREHNASMQARAACEAALVWAMNANANITIFWLLNRIYADRELLAALREEVAPFVNVAPANRDFAIPETQRLQNIDLEGLETKCPLLKSAYIESLRLDVAAWSFKVMRQDVLLSAREKQAEKFWIRKGTYTHIAHELHNKDPAYWDDPKVWRADRHIRYEGDGEKGAEKQVKVDMGSIRSYGKCHQTRR